jgi:hypothetical protein
MERLEREHADEWVLGESFSFAMRLNHGVTDLFFFVRRTLL